MAKWKQYGFGIALFVVMFAVIGIGLGLTGYLAVDMGQQLFGTGEGTESGSGESMQQAFASVFIVLILFQSAIIVFFAGPLVAGLAGTVSGIVTPELRDGVVIGGTGSFIGFYPMVLLALLITFLAFDTGASGGGSSGGSSMEFGQIAGQLLLGGVPTGVVGAVTGALSSQL